jgi:bifunctional non-homologous end joining protein LigD
MPNPPLHLSREGKTMQVDIGGHALELTNLDKVLFPEAQISKGEMIDYYAKVSPYMLPHLKGRLITMHRFPGGVREEKFYQKNVQEYFPPWINRVPIVLKSVGKQTYITCENKETLIFLANLAVEPHVWTSRVDKLRYPDRLIFDLDPPGDEFEPVKYAAQLLRELLKELGIEPFIMLTGSHGAHVTVPLDRVADYEEVRAFAAKVAELMRDMAPREITTEYRKNKRGQRVFIDVFRNSFAQTAVAPYAVRARPSASVAAPIEWKDLGNKEIFSAYYTLKNMLPRLQKQGDAWKGIFRKRFSIAGAGARLDSLTGS